MDSGVYSHTGTEAFCSMTPQRGRRKHYILLRYTRDYAEQRTSLTSVIMESQDLRLPGRRALLSSDVRCYECSVRRSIVMSVPFSGTAVKHGKLPVSISSIRDEKSKI